MKISIVSFQQHRNAELEAAEREYVKRLSRHARVELHALKGREADAGIPAHLLKAQRIVGLFVEGEMLSSAGLAQRLQGWMNQGCSHLLLVIGGAEGMPARAAAQVRERWSLSRVTFSHQLARLILLEAVYRAFDILHGGRYHK